MGRSYWGSVLDMHFLKLLPTPYVGPLKKQLQQNGDWYHQRTELQAMETAEYGDPILKTDQSNLWNTNQEPPQYI